jgi:pyruvate dehydrogenase E1 component beta subunit
MTTTEMTVRDALNRALDEALSADDRVLVLGEDVADPAGGVSGVTAGLSTRHGTERVLDTPISEAAIVGAAIGAALEGMLPVAEIMIMDFIGIALDQIANHAAKLRFMSGGRTPCPVTIRTAVFGGLGSGATHSQSLEAWFMHIPGLKVIVPSTPSDAKGLLTTAIFDPDPCVFIETVITYGARGPVPTDPGFAVPFGQADVKRAGRDVTVVTYGRGVFDALTAAEQVAADGIDVEVVDLRTLVPLDVAGVLASVARTKRAVVAHYATRFAGPGAELAATIGQELFGVLEAPVERVGARFTPIPAAAVLEAVVFPSAAAIADAVRRTVGFGRG